MVFFAENGHATERRCDVIFHALVKMGTGLLRDNCRSEGECVLGFRVGGGGEKGEYNLT